MTSQHNAASNMGGSLLSVLIIGSVNLGVFLSHKLKQGICQTLQVQPNKQMSRERQTPAG
jgi:hypothetical protein